MHGKKEGRNRTSAELGSCETTPTSLDVEIPSTGMTIFVRSLLPCQGWQAAMSGMCRIAGYPLHTSHERSRELENCVRLRLAGYPLRADRVDATNDKRQYVGRSQEHMLFHSCGSVARKSQSGMRHRLPATWPHTSLGCIGASTHRVVGQYDDKGCRHARQRPIK